MSSWIAWIQPILQASATRQQGKEQALQARMQADLLRERARQEMAATAADEAAHRREARMRIGRQAAAQAEAGIGTSGSAGLLLEQSSVLAELDALNIRYGGQMRSRGLLAESLMTRERGRAARRNAGLLAGAQLLSGFSKAYTSGLLAGG